MVNNSIKINKTSYYLSPHITEHKQNNDIYYSNKETQHPTFFVQI